MFSVYLLRVNETIKNQGEGGLPCSFQHDDQWVAKGQFRLQSDLFSAKGLGRVPKQHHNREEIIMIALKSS